MAETKQPAVENVVLDAGPIIHLNELDCLNLLSDFNRLMVPMAVWEEVNYYQPAALRNKNVLLQKTRIEKDLSSRSLIYNSMNLDKGEREAISLCIFSKEAILLTDDAAARLAANFLSIRTYGTIGVIIRGIRRGQLSVKECINYLEEIPKKSTLFIKKSLLSEIIEKVSKKYSH
jgi:predicted nucleic acid-binding protein